jgi:tetratricopeptide (TPR) repeat protein
LLRLQNELAYQIASNMQPSLSEDEKKHLADKLLTARQTDSPEAYRLYLLGRHALRKRNRETVPQAINHFNKAIEIDPLFAQAHAGLADCYVLLNSVAYGYMPTAEAMSRAKAAVKDALQIDDTLCEAHTSLGVIRMKYEWNWSEAERDFRRAISLDPDYPLAHFWYSQLLALIRRPAEAIKESEIAKALDPFSPLAEMNLGRVLYLTGQYEKAFKHFDKMLESNPDSVNVHYMLGLLCNQKGLLEASIKSFEKVYSLNPDLGVGPLGFAYARAGRREDAYKMLYKLKEIEKQRYVSDQEKALIYMGLGDKETAFFYFDKACKERSAPLPFIKVDPLFDGIRSDSRYTLLAQCANIAE